MRRTTVMVLTALVALAGCGPSQEEQAEERRAAAEKAETKRLQTDLATAVDAVAKDKDAKGRMPLPDAVAALEAKGYTAGSVPSRPLTGTPAYCVWLVDPDSGRSFVHQSADDASAEVDEEPTSCEPTVYPTEEAPAPTFGSSPADQEAKLRSEQVGDFLRTNATAIADLVDAVYIDGPVGDGAVTAEQKKVRKKKLDAVVEGLEDFEAVGEEPSAGFGYGVAFGDEEFCVYTYHQVKDGQAFVHQSLTDETTRAEPGSTTCDTVTALR